MHFVEHMLFTGSRRWSQEALWNYVAGRQGAPGGWTAEEHAGCHIEAYDGDIARTLTWLAEVVFQPTLAEAAMARERRVIFEMGSFRGPWAHRRLAALGLDYDLSGGGQRSSPTPGSERAGGARPPHLQTACAIVFPNLIIVGSRTNSSFSWSHAAGEFDALTGSLMTPISGQLNALGAAAAAPRSFREVDACLEVDVPQ